MSKEKNRWALEADAQGLDLPFIIVILNDLTSNCLFCLYIEEYFKLNYTLKHLLNIKK